MEHQLYQKGHPIQALWGAQALKLAPRSRRSLAAPRAVQRPDPIFPEDSSGRESSRRGEVVTIFTANGVVQLRPSGGHDLSRRLSPYLLQNPLPCPEEQPLCIGATFWVAATNGVDLGRRVNLQGFCQSPGVLCECVEDVVTERGGEVVYSETHIKGGIHEKLKMSVAVPFLFGIPPELDTLKNAIELGGGFLHRVYGQWIIV